VRTPKEDPLRYCLQDADELELANAGVKIERHYSRKAERPTPMDVEWAKDGVEGKLYIVQARPETVASRKPMQQVDEYRLGATNGVKPLVTGRWARIATGRAGVVAHVADLHLFRPGEVLVADTTMPDWALDLLRTLTS
jgi:pyruvate, water dikinase